jgi:ATP-dependent Lon protease
MMDSPSFKGSEIIATEAESQPSSKADGPSATLVPGAVEVLPILPLRDTVLFPGTIMPLSIGRASSLQLLEESLPQSKLLDWSCKRTSRVKTLPWSNCTNMASSVE